MRAQRGIDLNVFGLLFRASGTSGADRAVRAPGMPRRLPSILQRHGLDSPALRTCMNKAGHSLSKGCVEALIQAGEVSRAEVDRRAKSGH
jgi:hypothetical protein